MLTYNDFLFSKFCKNNLFYFVETASMDRIIILLESFYREIIIIVVLVFLVFRYLSKQSKKKSLVIDEKEAEVGYVAKIGQDISKEKLISILLLVGSIIILALTMYYFVPMFLDSVLPKDN
jgi:pilus assembly protein TadC